MHHSLQTAVAVAASLVALAFAMSTFERWRARNRRHELAWTVALVMFAVAAGALAAGAEAGWSGTTFRAFYLFGAIVNVPFLAAGTVYLLAGQRRGDLTAAGIALVSAFAAGVVVTAPLKAPIPRDQLAQGSRVFDVLPRVLAAVASAGGAAVIFGGAAWSAWQVWRNRTRPGRPAATTPWRLLWSNGLIALGTLVLASSGTLNSVFGAMTAFAVTLLVGIVVIFCGFLLATAGGPAQPRIIPPAPPWYPPVRIAALDGATSRPDRGAAPARS
jgi:hypothetical protein